VAYTVSWDNDERTCILLTWEAPLTWENIHAGYDDMCSLMQTVDYTVDWISDLSAGPNIPREDATTHLRALLQQTPRNAGMNVVVTQSMSLFTISLLNSFVNIVRWHGGFALATSVATARDLIRQRRSP
jgi:hypothetical protein